MIELKVKNFQKIIISTQILVRKIYKVSFNKSQLPKNIKKWSIVY